MTELETHVGTRGEAPEEVGFRNQLRARWRALPEQQRWAATIVVQLAIAFALWAPHRYRKWLLPAAALATAIMYPFFFSKMFTIPVFGAWPDIATGIYMLVFMMMAVGLNMVVGYAGLLDLGYVAFYATGAYTAAWFASLQFA